MTIEAATSLGPTPGGNEYDIAYGPKPPMYEHTIPLAEVVASLESVVRGEPPFAKSLSEPVHGPIKDHTRSVAYSLTEKAGKAHPDMSQHDYDKQFLSDEAYKKRYPQGNPLQQRTVIFTASAPRPVTAGHAHVF